jgi:membrane-bound lytic murein transglycosylase D
MPMAQLQLLNPSYKMDVVPFYSDKNHYLRLPKDKIAVFTSNENRIYAYVKHEEDQREKPYQSSRTAIARTEPKITKVESSVKHQLKSESISTDAVAYYVVQKGDNLGNIAKKFNVTIDELKEWNHLSDNSIQLAASMKVGFNEMIAKEEIASAPIAEFEKVEYIVKKGDNLGNIAKKFGSTMEDLKQWNNIQNNNIALGSSLIVAKSEIKPLKETITTNTFIKKENLVIATKNIDKDYLVKKGDSLFSIAKKYPGVTISDIKKWNDIRNEDLKPGMKLKING